jgi:hypothetical protein
VRWVERMYVLFCFSSRRYQGDFVHSAQNSVVCLKCFEFGINERTCELK